MSKLSNFDLTFAIRRLPKKLVELIQDNPNQLFVAGGYLRSIITNEPVSDIDLFAPSKDKAKEYADSVVGGCNHVHAGSPRLIETDNAYSIKGGFDFPIQFIHRWTFQAPLDVISSFDFTIACAAIWYDGSEWKSACHEQYYADLAAKRLVYLAPKRIEEVGGSMLRVLKFYQKGYRIPLNSLGVVIARLVSSLEMDAFKYRGDETPEQRENRIAHVVTGLLREVDPAVNPEYAMHLPAGEA